ncbi:MAG TPA: hypothetical protein VK816_06860 [Jatrophihabitantaceae bacterium]|jgi:Mce-associated membrane protein|nr:hypothetical protein [Jatrophihabitantaceae bacterium]
MSEEVEHRPVSEPADDATGAQESAVQRRGTAAAQAASRARRIGGRPRPDPAPSALGGAVLVEAPIPPVSAAEPAEGHSPRNVARSRAALLVGACVLVAGLVVAVVLAALSFHSTSPAKAREQLLAQVQERLIPAITYDYRHLQDDAKAAEAGLTGTFATNYAQSMQTVIIPQAPKLKAIVTADVSSVGLQSMSSDGKQAVVLVFAQQNTSNTANPTPRPDFATLDVTANYVRGQWLISQIGSVP